MALMMRSVVEAGEDHTGISHGFYLDAQQRNQEIRAVLFDRAGVQEFPLQFSDPDLLPHGPVPQS